MILDYLNIFTCIIIVSALYILTHVAYKYMHVLPIHTGCRCPKCWSEASGQYVMPAEDLLGSYTLSDVHMDGDHLRMFWTEDVDQHTGEHSIEWLKENAYSDEILAKRAAEARPKPLESDKLSVFDFKDVFSSKEARLDWLVRIYEDGCSLLRGVPSESGMVKKICNYIYQVQPTCYSDMFDVFPLEKSTNVAYTEDYLPLHADLNFYQSTPGIQVLHALKRDDCVTGGETVLVDSLFAAEEFRRLHPHEFATLTKAPVTYWRVRYGWKKPAHYNYQRPIFTLGYNDEIICVHWYVQGEGPPFMPPDLVEDYYQARSMWATFLKNFPVAQTFPLLTGYCMTTNNHRMFHGRKEMHLNGGQRHLQGSYVNIDDFKSVVLALCNIQGRPLKRYRQGNGDLLQ